MTGKILQTINPVTGNLNTPSVPGTTVGCFMKMTQNPASDTCLVDYDAGAPGYHRLKVQSDGYLTAETSFTNIQLTVTSRIAWPLNSWAYYKFALYTSLSANGYQFYTLIGIYGLGGTLLDQVFAWTAPFSGNAARTWACSLGIGSTTSSAYAYAPNNATMKFSKMQINDSGDVSYPTHDPSGGSVLYLGRQTLGTTAKLIDSSGSPVNPVSAPVLSPYTGPYSYMGPGLWYVGYTYTSYYGESLISPLSSITLAPGQTGVSIAAIGLPSSIWGTNFYVSQVVGSQIVGLSGNGDGSASGVTGAGSNTPPPTINTCNARYDLIAGHGLTIYADGPYT